MVESLGEMKKEKRERIEKREGNKERTEIKRKEKETKGS